MPCLVWSLFYKTISFCQSWLPCIYIWSISNAPLFDVNYCPFKNYGVYLPKNIRSPFPSVFSSFFAPRSSSIPIVCSSMCLPFSYLHCIFFLFHALLLSKSMRDYFDNSNNLESQGIQFIWKRPEKKTVCAMCCSVWSV